MKIIFQSAKCTIVSGLLLLCFSTAITAQEKDGVDTALIPFWESTTMYNESVLMISNNGELPFAKLLFRPDKIISVTNSGLNIDYKEGIDWEYKDGQLRLLKGSKAACMTSQQLYPDASKDAFPKKGGGLIYFKEGSFFHDHQLAVTYLHSAEIWEGPVSSFQGKYLPNTIRKLTKKSPLHLLLFGDSIAAGANASGENNASPYLPSWGNLIAEKLRRYYNAPVEFTNTAVGGKDSKWGLETIKNNVVDHHPDLVIIAFGMNDGTSQMSPELFKENISGMIKKVRLQNPHAEYLLVSTMLPNPESNFVGTQLLFKKVLSELTGQGIVLVDMGAVHAELLKHKSYQDMTGNNINHPNDFLIRWYAQQMLNVLIPHAIQKNK